jgi:hypothetical protein
MTEEEELRVGNAEGGLSGGMTDDDSDSLLDIYPSVRPSSNSVHGSTCQEPGRLSLQPGADGQHVHNSMAYSIRDGSTPMEPDWWKRRSSATCLNQVFLAVVMIAIVGIIAGISVPILKRNSSEASSNGNNNDLDSTQRLDTIKKLALFSSLDDLNSEGSPQHSALMWIVEEDILSIDGGNDEEEKLGKLLTRYVLAVFYYSLGGHNWAMSGGWLEPQLEVCDWQFVNCTGEEIQTVQAIEVVFGNNLQGPLPSELQHLPRLGE